MRTLEMFRLNSFVVPGFSPRPRNFCNLNLSIFTRENDHQMMNRPSLTSVLNLFLQTPSIFVELGSGRGMMTYWLAQALGKEKYLAKFLLIDKASHRHKLDNRLKDDPKVNTERIRVDIQDLALRNAPMVAGSKLVKCPIAHLWKTVKRNLLALSP